MSRFRFDEDYHVHSTFSDDAVSSLEHNVIAAQQVGLTTMCLVDHVRVTTQWVPELVASVAALRERSTVTLLSGAETKMLDRTGALDLPSGLDGLDCVLIADHQFPSETGPLSPADVRDRLASGEFSHSHVIECLIDATTSAMRSVERPVVAHFLSLLPKVGLDETVLGDALLDEFARGARRANAIVEVNEKWNCPSSRVITALDRRGVHLVAGSDSHDCVNVGAYDGVRRLVADAFATVGSPT